MAIFQSHAYNLQRLINVLLVLFISLSHTQNYLQSGVIILRNWLGLVNLPSRSGPETPTH